ncbi:hypothetical protein Trydic_g1508 [Trypoxylus dichotomus]
MEDAEIGAKEKVEIIKLGNLWADRGKNPNSSFTHDYPLQPRQDTEERPPDTARIESSPIHQQQNGKPLPPPAKSQGLEAAPPQQVRCRTPATTTLISKQHKN